MIKNSSLLKDHLLSQKEGNIVSDMDGEKVMLSIENGKYYNLGEVGGDIWDLMEQPVSLQDMVAALTSQYNVTMEECEEQVLSFLDHLAEEGLIKTHSR
ncbi:lasso peptide biosynthesis PqqD family chaperone [Jeotgalibacillus sp. S-D1]|uniref:lasso peptide biosynthesis PqqD family chaperone n=1 Tax=Jeotgalibacillus sp. S-D1 TaxID=2552189 RepID=UPI0010594F0E|nr:lasso peptide biosynthesis PqqD family chaperone [Jeotgalibacillus sp. S-D1]TDL31807.1 lasso peptide biosynthesis PqqD family chaperone [Jeotgalibacillus sp. S-D1]